MTAEDYREAHELKVRQSLVGADLRERYAANARARIEADPQRWEQMLDVTPEVRAERLALALERRREVRHRAAVQAVQRSLTLNASQVRSQQIRDRYDALAREHGHADMAQMLAATVTMTSPALAELLGVRKHDVTQLRGRHGIRSLGRQTAAAERRREREDSARAQRPPDPE